MVEVPAAALMLPAFLRYFDFVSIGTNDLIQYTLAIDRADEAVAHLYNPWHPAVLQLVAQTIAGARAIGKEVSVCGEMAGDTAFSELLLAMGLRSFSMHPSQIVADQGAHPRDRCGALGRGAAADPRGRRSGARMRRCGESRRAGKSAASARRSGPSGSGLRNCAIVAPLVLLQSGASALKAHRGLGRFRQTGLTGLSKTCQNRGLR